MAGIGVRLPAAILSDGDDLQRYQFSSFAEEADSGMTLRRQAGQTERAIAGIPSTAVVTAVAQRVTEAGYDWLRERLGLPLQLRLAGFSAVVVLKSVRRERRSARSETLAWGVRIVFYIVERN